MAKKSAIENNDKRKRLVKEYKSRRDKLKAVIMNKETSPDERFQAVIKLASLPRNSAENRVRNRCEVNGRPRGYYRKFGISRVSLRELGSVGKIPGLTKSSW